MKKTQFNLSEQFMSTEEERKTAFSNILTQYFYDTYNIPYDCALSTLDPNENLNRV